jgi:2-phospho-L-lactate/phosphoenolpyruvate guanylyltransferase
MTAALPFRPAVLVPLKPLAEAKSRLREALGEPARTELVLAMLTDVLAAVRAAYAGPVYLVTSDHAYAAQRERFDADWLPDRGTDYNSAVAAALRSEAVLAAGAAIVLPADLPRATPEDIASAIEALSTAEVVLVPAHSGGTGLLGLRPPRAMAPAFGPRSAEAHRHAAIASGRRLTDLDAPSLAQDIDTIADLVALFEDTASLGAATRAFLATHSLEALQTGLPHGDR